MKRKTRRIFIEINDIKGVHIEHLDINYSDHDMLSIFKCPENHDVIFPQYAVKAGVYIMKCILVHPDLYGEALDKLKDLHTADLAAPAFPGSKNELKPSACKIITLKQKGLKVHEIAELVSLSESGVRKVLERLYTHYDVHKFQALYAKVRIHL